MNAKPSSKSRAIEAPAARLPADGTSLEEIELLVSVEPSQPAESELTVESVHYRAETTTMLLETGISLSFCTMRPSQAKAWTPKRKMQLTRERGSK
jgi:hypothetical protein